MPFTPVIIPQVFVSEVVRCSILTYAMMNLNFVVHPQKQMKIRIAKPLVDFTDPQSTIFFAPISYMMLES